MPSDFCPSLGDPYPDPDPGDKSNIIDLPKNATCNDMARCRCSGIYKASGGFSVKDRCKWIKTIDQSTGRETGDGSTKWNGELILDQVGKRIIVRHNMFFVNVVNDPN